MLARLVKQVDGSATKQQFNLEVMHSSPWQGGGYLPTSGASLQKGICRRDELDTLLLPHVDIKSHERP